MIGIESLTEEGLTRADDLNMCHTFSCSVQSRKQDTCDVCRVMASKLFIDLFPMLCVAVVSPSYTCQHNKISLVYKHVMNETLARKS